MWILHLLELEYQVMGYEIWLLRCLDAQDMKNETAGLQNPHAIYDQ